jgi:hypothetical protein
MKDKVEIILNRCTIHIEMFVSLTDVTFYIISRHTLRKSLILHTRIITYLLQINYGSITDCLYQTLLFI